MLLQILLAIAATAAARLHSPLLRRASYGNGIATFNNYASQSNTNCGPMSGQPGTYGAAASDVSPDISGGKCSGSIDKSVCNGQSPGSMAMAASCPKTNCGKCYKVTNQGGVPVDQAVSGIGNSVIVQIIDSCPQTNPQNFCKTDMPANQRCEDPNTNQLDIDQSAYEALTGQAFSSGPNLQILIEDSDCSGGDKTGDGSAPSSAAASSSSPATTSNPSDSTPLESAPPSSTTSPLDTQGSGTDGSTGGQPGDAALSSSSSPAAASSSSPAQTGIIPGADQGGQLLNDECYDGDVSTS